MRSPVSRAWRRRAGVGCLAAAMVVALSPTPATAEPIESLDPVTDSAPDVEWPDALPGNASVTLITGDKVNVRTNPDGRTSVGVSPSPTGSSLFRTETTMDGELYVYPDGVEVGIADGLLDRELFNVTRLVDYGYDDASTDALPVIVEYTDAPSTSTLARRTDGLPATGDVLALNSLGSAATTVDKAKADDFYADVEDNRVERVWLDAKMEVQLDESVPLVGAPDAWDAGFDGDGVTVAILDTGYDPNHPDLTESVIGSHSFIEGQDVQDLHGHGTHVASTVAGNGAAADGAMTGVAPGADLLIGKVLDNSGNGPWSGIIAGMEWAVAEGADIVSMSLGVKTASESDLVSETVDALSASSGALFVIAAGNDSLTGYLGTPGIAKLALTVGASDKQDGLASFSNKGPRPGDNGVKPEITAPGVDIVAARAEGTSMGTPVDEHYTSANGTSMATPHVAGAAALLKQQHPEWTAAELKDALVSTARTLPEHSVFEQGGGILDVGTTVASAITATGVASFGVVRDEDAALTRTVTYTNTGDTDVVLDLSLELDREVVPVEGVALSTDTVTVPANGTADVTITLDPTADEYGQYNGYLVAEADGTRVQTAVAFLKEVPRENLTLNLTNRLGDAPDNAWVYVIDVAGKAGVVYSHYVPRGSQVTIPVPAGVYAVFVQLNDVDPEMPLTASIDYFLEPEVTISDDMTLDVDGRKARNLDPRVTDEKRDLKAGSVYLAVTRERADGRGITFGHYDTVSFSNARFGIIPSETVATHGTFDVNADVLLREPIVSGELKVGRETHDIDMITTAFTGRVDGKRKYTAVSVGDGEEAAYADVDVTGKMAVITGQLSVAKADRAIDHGAVATLFTTAEPEFLQLLYLGSHPDVPLYGVAYEDGERLRSALADGDSFSLTVDGRLDSSYTYLIPFDYSGSVPDDLTKKTRKRDFAKLENEISGNVVGDVAFAITHSWRPGATTSFQTSSYSYAPVERDDYVYAKNMAYQQEFSSSINSNGAVSEPITTYKAGKTYEREWLSGPLRPGTNQMAPCAYCRTGDALTFLPSSFADSDPTHYGTSPQSTITYHRDGVPIADPTTLAVPEKSTYQIRLTTDRESPFTKLGSYMDTRWTFVSQGPKKGTVDGCEEAFSGGSACAALPVILVGYDMDLDDLNRAKADKKFSFDVTTDRADGYRGDARVTQVEVEVSYDDGSTWSDADKVKLGRDGEHSVSVKHPKLSKTSGTVSLRVTVWDDAGNKTEQTIIKAYGLK
ncbi:S8 family peptidase [Stackebrandtia soli]|uniref:S8 family peptidase n=1 Tax=Stackebrandtia soli TaxID=1892856 RepID=UPI0039EB6466